MNYAAAYTKVVRYAADSWSLFRQRLESEPSLRWGTHEKAAEERPIMADAYADHTGDEEGAALLRDSKQHVVFDGDRVRKGRFTTKHVVGAADAADDLIYQLPGVETHFFGNADVVNRRTASRYRDEDFNEPPKPLSPHHVRVVHIDPAGAELPYHADVHYADLGRYLADELNRHADDQAYWDEVPDDDQHPHGLPAIDAALEHVRKAPYEEVDPL